MTAFATPEDIAHRTAAARDAAVAAGRELGLEITEGKVLYELFSVVVHLAPSPVVARVPTVLPHTTTPESLAQRQQQELDVAQWLHDRGTPVIPPSPLVERKPVRRDGFSITFWPFTDEDRSSEPDYVKNSELSADLHRALRDYPGELEFLSSAEPRFVREGLRRLEGGDLVTEADLRRAWAEWEVLEPLASDEAAFRAKFPQVDLQPIHGDSPPANIFASTDGPLFSDFELITYGPVEWDLAGLGPELTAAYDRGARKNGLRELDPEVLRFVNAVGAIRVLAYLSCADQLPAMVEFMRPFLDQWRGTDPYA
ncbi:aminoglycoside phosphotransferase family protein [Lentzea sp. CC55]|uniref:aminoglycoside phosphotransferase family protein n=1 Tax=Lentzea sp. CC55 TaxID=2884909 RepID=UPI001F3DD177|nr:aminoglycoside phosphotransferase family protein [Lentzea sp. CC55]MCG8924950.1 aminoglycoside phosphotransferase family protein [Lentzea sp. CC55]